MCNVFDIAAYDYDLPETLIAQSPAAHRGQSRLLVMRRGQGDLSHRKVTDLPDLLCPSDLLVLNNTKVIRARLRGVKETGGKAEVLILDYVSGIRAARDQGAFACRCLVKASRPPAPGTRILFGGGLSARVEASEEGMHVMRFSCGVEIDEILDGIGEVPLPPYIRRHGAARPACDDGKAYQTIYAERKGAVAAPTAGLHLSADLLARLARKGVAVVPVTLHVGYGTFMPVRVGDIRRHRMHSEWYEVSEKTARTINLAKHEGRRIVAVGTTSVRTLEYASDSQGRVEAGTGLCDLFIHPGYRFKVVDALMTNFHLPRSTLLMLVAAFAGREKVLEAYGQAVERRYRFYSYGDAMLMV